jgi:enoyl-CoA hydratase
MTGSADAGQGELLVEVNDGVMVLTVNRPARRNAMTKAVAEQIAAALDQMDASPDIAVAVLTGAGGNFCAGMDLERFALGELPKVPGRGFAGFAEAPPRKPIIAAVEGWALGGGFELVFACDLAVAGESARFGLPEVKRGLIARGGGAVRLPRLVPRAVAMQILLAGEPLVAARAHHFGLINEVVPDGTAVDAAKALALGITKNAPLAVAATKRLVLESADWPSTELFERQVAITDPVFESEDAVEGRTAFAERREPVWTGR